MNTLADMPPMFSFQALIWLIVGPILLILINALIESICVFFVARLKTDKARRLAIQWFAINILSYPIMMLVPVHLYRLSEWNRDSWYYFMQANTNPYGLLALIEVAAILVEAWLLFDINRKINITPRYFILISTCSNLTSLSCGVCLYMLMGPKIIL
jgi:hypothetical protein